MHHSKLQGLIDWTSSTATVPGVEVPRLRFVQHASPTDLLGRAAPPVFLIFQCYLDLSAPFLDIFEHFSWLTDKCGPLQRRGDYGGQRVWWRHRR